MVRVDNGALMVLCRSTGREGNRRQTVRGERVWGQEEGSDAVTADANVTALSRNAKSNVCDLQ